MSERPREAIILAAGHGTRMWPLSATRPKPVLPVGGQPLLARLIQQVAHAGIDHVTLVAAAREDPVTRVAQEASNRHDLTLDVAIQDTQRGTGHALAQANLPNDPFLVVYGDLFLPEGALAGFVDTLSETGAGIGARHVEDISAYGALTLKEDALVGIEEKPERSEPGWVNAGVYLLPGETGEALDRLGESPRGEVELTDAVTELLEKGHAFGVHGFDAWLDVGYPWDVLKANRAVLEEMTPRVRGEVHPSAELTGPVHVAKGAEVRAGSVVKGPVWIGPDARVGPNAYVRAATTLGPGSKVGHGCEVKNSVLFEEAKVPHVSYVGDSVLGRDVNLGAGTQVANLRHDEQTVRVDTPKGRVDSGRRKLGVVLGDGVKTGVNASLNVGVLLGPGETVRPGETVGSSRL